jgi:WD40 repeat protein
MRLPSGNEPVANVTLSHLGNGLVASTWNRALFYWDLKTTNMTALPSGFDRALFTLDDSRLILLRRNGPGAIWNYNSRAIEKKLQFQSSSGFDAAISPDGRILAVPAAVDLSNTIELMNLETGQSIGVLAGHKQGVTSVAFSSEGKTLASSSIDGLKLWNVATLQEILSVSVEGARSPVFSNSGTMLAFSSRDSSGERIHLLRASYGPAGVARHE